MRRFVKGFRLYWKGFTVGFKDKKLLSLQIFPWIIDLILFGAGLILLSRFLMTLITALVQRPHFWYQWVLYYALLALGFLGGLAVLFCLLSIILNVVQFPFNDSLARRTLAAHTALPVPEGHGFRGWLGNMKVLALRTAIFMLIAVGLFLAGFIPGLGVVVLILSFLLMAYDSMDYVFDLFHWTFRERLRFIRGHFGAFFGFSLALGLSRLVPVVNVFLLPLGVISSAMFVADHMERS